MKTAMKLFTTAIMFIAIMSTSCDDGNDNRDTEKPVIDLIEPEDGDTLLIGDEKGIHFDLELSDNDMLKSYKVDIHPNFNGHNHSKAGSAETVDFYFNKSWDVSGQKNATIHHHEIIIPVNSTPGNYHLMVFCTDNSGNESYIARSIVLSTEDGEEHHH